MIRVPTLLRPRLVAMRNRWRAEHTRSSSVFRDLIVLFFGIAVTYSIYKVSLVAITKVEDVSGLVYFSPSIPFSILLLLLLVMLLVSNSLTALGAFFLSKDLELVLSAPITRFRFFCGKISSIVFISSWMPLIFIIPLLLAYGTWYQGGGVYYLTAVLALPPYFLIPAALAIVLATVFTAVIPASRTRYVAAVVVGLFLGFFYVAAELVSSGVRTGGDLSELLRMFSVVSLPEQIWLPSHWVAIALRDAIEGRFGGIWVPLLLLYGTALGLLALAYLTVGFLFETAYSRSCDSRRHMLVRGRRFWNAFVRWVPFLKPDTRALLLKEYRIFFRDMPQVIQLVMLGGVYLVYLYNLRIFGLLEGIPNEQRATWQSFIYIINVSMGAFISTAASTRLVFPSISLEGRAYWMIQTAPLNLKRMMEVKYWSWFLPIGILSSVVFISGALAIKMSSFAVATTFLAGWVLSAGIVGIGIGLGAVFANFQWEHSAQLAASFGSFVFMLCSIVLITFNMVPIGFLLFVREPGMAGEFMPDTAWYLVVVCCASFVIALNLLVFAWSLEVGERSLKARM